MAENTEHPSFAQVLIDAMRSEHRRRILKLAVETGEPVSPSMASRHTGIPLTISSNHFRKLDEAGLLAPAFKRPKGGAEEHFYIPVPSLVDHPIVQAVLFTM